MDKTLPELIALCKERGIKGYSGKKKAEVVALLGSGLPDDGVIRYIDLFCGLGAFHTAFNTSPKFKCVLACDIDEGARKIYEANYGLKPEGDIRKLDLARMPDFEVLCAGFPCQPFSIAGNGEGFKDTTKGNLFYDILKIVDAKRPPMCILENVKNLKTHDGGRTYKTIVTELETRGYKVSSRVINSADYGSPQARQRIFIVASRAAFAIPEPIKKYMPVSSIIDPANADSWDSSNYTLVAKTGVAKQGKPHIIFDVMTKKSKKGGRQGERVYDINAVGVTVCASSGGPGAKTGLYKVGEKIRRLSVKETLGMFGFPATYKFPGISSEEALFYLGNSIVVNVPLTFVSAVEKYFTG
jgi:DNA (cytosine-5)-methyltransferase 1